MGVARSRASIALVATCVVISCGLDDSGLSSSSGGQAGVSGEGGAPITGGTGGGGSGGVGAKGGSGGTTGGGGNAGKSSGGAGSGGTSAVDASSGGVAGTANGGQPAGGSGGTTPAGGSGGTGSKTGGGGAGGAPPIPSCTTLYSGGNAVKAVCGEEPGPTGAMCRLHVDTDPNDGDGVGKTCSQICQAAGGECIKLLDNGTDNCTPNTGIVWNCATTNDQTNAVCYCSRGCGVGLPCSGGQTCTTGKCI